MGREEEEDREDLGTWHRSVALPVPATLSLRGTGESGQAWRAAGMQNQPERVGTRENVLAREWGRKDMHATEMGGERQGGEPRVCPPIPFPRDKSRTSSTAPTGILHGIRVPTPFFTRVGHPDTWVPWSRYREEREEKPGQQVKFQNIL